MHDSHVDPLHWILFTLYTFSLRTIGTMLPNLGLISKSPVLLLKNMDTWPLLFYSYSVSLYGDLGIGILTEYHKCFWSQSKSVFYQHFISKKLFVIEGWKSSQCLDYNLKTQRKAHMFQNIKSIFRSNPALLWLWDPA